MLATWHNRQVRFHEFEDVVKKAYERELDEMAEYYNTCSSTERGGRNTKAKEKSTGREGFPTGSPQDFHKMLWYF